MVPILFESPAAPSDPPLLFDTTVIYQLSYVVRLLGHFFLLSLYALHLFLPSLPLARPSETSLNAS